VTDSPQFRWTSAAATHVGLVRQINEDAFLDEPERGLWAVADGMGGHSRGDVASRMVVDGLRQLPALPSLPDYCAAVRERLQETNRRLREEAMLRDVAIIGSTVVVLLAGDGKCALLWAGDSRIYLYRNGKLMQLTRDHSQIEELKANGSLGIDTTLFHPARNLITRAVGAADTLEVDEESIAVCDADMFLLCSDGVSNEVDEADMCAAMAGGSCRQAADSLIDLALRGGGRDNISAVVVRANDLSPTENTLVNPALSPQRPQS
jgi:protein phosphatase